MKTNCSFKRILFSFFCCSLLLNSLASINAPIYSAPSFLHSTAKQVERGLEIRYMIITDKNESEKKDITIDGVTYPLFKTKELAIETTKYANPKKDYTVVYVLTDKKKNTEIISISEDNN